MRHFFFFFFVSHNTLSRWEGKVLYPTIDMAVTPLSSHERDQCHGTLAASSLFFASRSSPPDFLFLGDCNGLSGVFPANRCTLMGGNKRRSTHLKKNGMRQRLPQILPASCYLDLAFLLTVVSPFLPLFSLVPPARIICNCNQP